MDSIMLVVVLATHMLTTAQVSMKQPTLRPATT